MNYQLDWNFLLVEILIGFEYIPTVLLLALVPLVVGLILGGFIAIIRIFKLTPLAQIFTCLVIFLRGVPVVLQLTILYLAVTLWAENISEWLGYSGNSTHIPYITVALIGLSINATVYISEIIRTALQAVDFGQYEAGYSVGMTSRQILQRIVLPQSLPIALPLLGNYVIELIKNSSVASLISVMEIVSATSYAANANYKFLEAYLAAAIVYWLICVGVENIIFFLENRLGFEKRGRTI